MPEKTCKDQAKNFSHGPIKTFLFKPKLQETPLNILLPAFGCFGGNIML
jgi:hypothetical protein